MPVQRVPIQFPFEGKVASVAYSRQPLVTTEDVLNMRPLDAKTDRLRGAQRAGTERHVATAVSAGFPVVDLGIVVADDAQITYAQLSLGAIVDDGTDGSWNVTTSLAAYSPITDAAGNFYTITGAATWVKYNPQGWKLAETAVPVLHTDALIRTIAVDSEESVYVAVTVGSTATVAYWQVQPDARVYKYQLRFDGSYELAYSGAVTTELGAAPGTVALVTRLVIKDDIMYIVLWDATAGVVVNMECEVQRYDAVNELARLPGVADFSFVVNEVALGLDVDSQGNVLVTHHVYPFTSGLVQGVTKYSPAGLQLSQTLAASVGGLGHSCVFDSDGGFYTTGVYDTTNHFCRYFNAAGTEVWKYGPTVAIAYNDHYGITMAVDADDNGYIPQTVDTSAGDIYVFNQAGSLLVQFSTKSAPLGCAIPPGDLLDATAEFVFYGMNTFASNATFGRARILSATTTSGSHRTTKLLAVCNGDIKAESGAAWVIPTGGSAALDTLGEFTHGVTMFGKRYWTDGRQYKVYDLATDTVSDFIATAAGGIPQKCKIISRYGGRMVLARGLTGHDWYMSKTGDPGNFNFNVIPPVPPDSAVEGVNSDVGAVPDIINCFMPWNDDLGFWGCDHSIWRMTGNPFDGGQIDDVSKTIGVAFGNRSWARDASGRIYFLSTEGDVFELTPPGSLRNISVDSLNRSVKQIDLTTKYAVLTWSEEEHGLYMHVANRAAFGTNNEHYFWSAQTQGWFPLKYANASQNPRAVATLDGDLPSDRVILLGGEDGIVRRYDEDGRNDDGSAIYSYVFLGPYGLPESGKQLRLTKWQVTLSGTDQGIGYELYASNTADSKGSSVAQGTLDPGKNQVQFTRARGEFFWIKLYSQALNSTWALETGWMTFAPAGRQRR